MCIRDRDKRLYIVSLFHSKLVQIEVIMTFDSCGTGCRQSNARVQLNSSSFSMKFWHDAQDMCRFLHLQAGPTEKWNSKNWWANRPANIKTTSWLAQLVMVVINNRYTSYNFGFRKQKRWGPTHNEIRRWVTKYTVPRYWYPTWDPNISVFEIQRCAACCVWQCYITATTWGNGTTEVAVWILRIKSFPQRSRYWVVNISYCTPFICDIPWRTCSTRWGVPRAAV